jgi:hypothetical protein
MTPPPIVPRVIFLLGSMFFLVGGTVAFLRAIYQGRSLPIIGQLIRALCILIAFDGFYGFLSLFFAISIGLDWLPRRFEWPAGIASALDLPNGQHAVPNLVGRLQIYDRNWRFVSGWQAGDLTKDGTGLVPAANELIAVYTLENGGTCRSVYDLNGDQISRMQVPMPAIFKFPTMRWHYVPSKWWLWGFTSPLMGLAMFAVFGAIASSFKTPAKSTLTRTKLGP